MGLQNVDMASVMRRLADRRIEDAMKEGKFDKIQGMGEPLNLEDAPAEENARLMWWTLRILKNNNFIPDEVTWRKAIDHLKGRLAVAKGEAEVATLVGQVNELVRMLNTLGTNAIKADIAMMDEGEEIARFRKRTAAGH